MNLARAKLGRRGFTHNAIVAHKNASRLPAGGGQVSGAYLNSNSSIIRRALL